MSVVYEPIIGYCTFISYEEGREIEEMYWEEDLGNSGYFGLINQWRPSKGYYIGILNYLDGSEKITNLSNLSFSKEKLDDFSEFVSNHKELEKYIDKMNFYFFNKIF